MKLKLIVLLVAVAAALGFSAPAQAQSAGIPCFGADADYVAAFDAKDGVVDGAVRYPERRMYQEVQGWVTRAGEVPGHHSEHIHSGACWPQGETWVDLPAQVERVDFKQVFHNVVGYNVVDIRGGFVDAGIPFTNTSAQMTELKQKADASKDTTTVAFQTYGVNIAQATCSGRVETRTGMDLRGRVGPTPGFGNDPGVDGLVARWFTSTGWSSYLPGSKPLTCYKRNTDPVISRNWTTPFDYGNNALGPAPIRASTWSQPKAQPFTVKTDWASGVNRGSLLIDPNFHVHPDNPGIWNRAVTVDGQSFGVSGIPSGMHKLVLLGHEGGGTKITSTVVTVLPISVA